MEKNSEIFNASEGGRIIKEDEEENNIVKRMDSSPTVSKTSCDDQAHKRSNDNNEKDCEDGDVKLSSPSTSSEHNKDSTILKQGEEMESTKAEMGEVMEENQRLKKSLDQIMKEYEALQRKFSVMSEQQSKQPVADLEIELSLGRTSSGLDSKKRTISTMLEEENNKKNSGGGEDKDRSLTLTLDSKFEESRPLNSSPGNSSGEAKGREDVVARNTSDKRNENGEEEMVQQPPVKKARVSVRARCDTPTMNDGCQWRKYGQKIAKGNPCPRAYYRCTVAPSCPVRKQVQRCVDDMSILISTYEGVHNHPLPISATAMASTTSAAAYMLTSGSSTSPNQGSHFSTTTTTDAYGSDNHNFKAGPTKPQPFYLSTNSSTYSHGPIHPTITLDLTSPTPSSTNQVSKMPLNIASKYSSTHSLDNFNNNALSSLPNGLLNYGDQSYMNKTQASPLNIVSSKHPTSRHQDQLLNFHTLFQKSNQTNVHSNQDYPLPDTIAQAAKVLTSDPSFQSVLSAALSSFMSGNNNNDIGKTSSIYNGRVNNTLNSMDFNRNIKGTAVLQTPSSSNSKALESASKGNHGCTSSLFPSPFKPFPISKSSSSSPSDISDRSLT